jgi:hypothetical protein
MQLLDEGGGPQQQHATGSTKTSCTFLTKQDNQQFHNDSGTETTPDCYSIITTPRHRNKNSRLGAVESTTAASPL